MRRPLWSQISKRWTLTNIVTSAQRFWKLSCWKLDFVSNSGCVKYVEKIHKKEAEDLWFKCWVIYEFCCNGKLSDKEVSGSNCAVWRFERFNEDDKIISLSQFHQLQHLFTLEHAWCVPSKCSHRIKQNLNAPSKHFRLSKNLDILDNLNG